MIEAAPSSFLRKGGLKKIWIILPLCLALLNITACDYINDKLYPSFKANPEKTIVDKPPFARNEGKPNISIEKVRDVAEASSIQEDDSFTVNPVAINKEAKNSNDQNEIFASPVENDEERFKRLEKNVQRISDTLNKMSPSITKLMGVESELDMLTFQLEDLINKGVYTEKENRQEEFVQEQLEEQTPLVNETPAKPDFTKEVMLKKAAPQAPKLSENIIKEASKDSSKDTNNLINKMRIGDHSGKTRIVFETSEKIDYNATIDNDSKQLVITFPKGYLDSNPNKLSHISDLIKSISQTKEDDGGAILTFELTQETEKLKDFRMAPDNEVSRQRIVIDLKR